MKAKEKKPTKKVQLQYNSQQMISNTGNDMKIHKRVPILTAVPVNNEVWCMPHVSQLNRRKMVFFSRGQYSRMSKKIRQKCFSESFMHRLVTTLALCRGHSVRLQISTLSNGILQLFFTATNLLCVLPTSTELGISMAIAHITCSSAWCYKGKTEGQTKSDQELENLGSISKWMYGGEELTPAHFVLSFLPGMFLPGQLTSSIRNMLRRELSETQGSMAVEVSAPLNYVHIADGPDQRILGIQLLTSWPGKVYRVKEEANATAR